MTLSRAQILSLRTRVINASLDPVSRALSQGDVRMLVVALGQLEEKVSSASVSLVHTKARIARRETLRLPVFRKMQAVSTALSVPHVVVLPNPGRCND